MSLVDVMEEEEKHIVDKEMRQNKRDKCQLAMWRNFHSDHHSKKFKGWIE